MRLRAPYPQNPAVEGDSAPFARPWLDWLRDFWAQFGWSNSIAVFGDIPMEARVFADFEFPTGADTTLSFIARLGNDYKGASALYPFFEYYQDDNTDGNILWDFGFSAAGYGETLAVVGANSILQAAPGVLNAIDRVEGDTISDLDKGDTIIASIKRVGTDPTDTYGGSVYLLGSGLKAQREGIGWEKPHP